jgi:hypothetical protein
MLSSTPSEQILRATRGKRNRIRGIRGNIHISLRDREFDPLVTKPLVDAFSQFMLDQILIKDVMPPSVARSNPAKLKPVKLIRP